MADQAEQLDRARRLAAARKVERGVQELVTALAFGEEGNAEPYTGPAGASMLADVGAVLRRSGDTSEAELRLRAAGRLKRAAANTTSTDAAGLMGASAPLPAMGARPSRRAASRQPRVDRRVHRAAAHARRATVGTDAGAAARGRAAGRRRKDRVAERNDRRRR